MEEIENGMLDQKRDSNQIISLWNLTQSPAAALLSLHDVEARLELLEGYWSECLNRDYMLQRYSDKYKERTYFKSGVFGSTQTHYLNAKAWLRKRIQELKSAEEAPARIVNRAQGHESTSTQAALEKMRLPTFEGNHQEWQHFKEKFTALIVNDPRMDNIIKMQHLSNCLGKEPAEKLKTIKFSGDNFLTAWNSLCSRYDNKYLCFSVQMEAIVNMPGATVEKLSHLAQLINTIDGSINCFATLGRPYAHWDDIFVYLIESKLAESTRLEWSKELASRRPVDGFAKYEELKQFLEDKIRSLDVIETRIKAKSQIEEHNEGNDAKSENSGKDRKRSLNNQTKKGIGAHVAIQHTSKATSKPSCSFCKGEHFIGYCSRFSACSQSQRRAHALTAKLCFNCLNQNHSADACQSKGRCFVCGSKHHTKLHQDSQATSCATATASETDQDAESEAVQAHSVQSQATAVHAARKVLLATACVLLQGPNGQSVSARALLDSAAEESFVSEHVVQALSLNKSNANVVVSGVGGSASAISKGRVSVTLKSKQDCNFSITFSALVLRKLTAMIPSAEVKIHNWSHLVDIQLADPHFSTPSRIDCILNSEAYAAVLLPGIKRGVMGTPVAVNSVFGWVLMGKAGPSENEKALSTSIHHISIDQELSNAVARLWEIEEIPSEPLLSPSEQECYNHFKQTHTRSQEGRFIVRLPFIKPPGSLDTRQTAEKCLFRLERRFAKQPELANAYKDFMQTYIDMGHMEVMTPLEVSEFDTYYLPHHPVLKGGDQEKIRVVFNASQQNGAGVSLNSLLHVGPKLQEDVLVIMVRWAFFPIVFTCDVKKMFRQFLVHKEDANWQRIVWRTSPELAMETFRLLTVTYGTISAPFIANACMLQLATDEQRRYPKGAKVLLNGRYVDDVYAGDDSVEEAVKVRNEVVNILRSAGMEVGKWASNRVELLADLEDVTNSNESAFDQEGSVSTLGLRWLSAEDAFCFKVSPVDVVGRVTKRLVLSEISKLYDPVGWLAPVIIVAKVLLQNLWLQGVEWDDPVSEELKEVWQNFRKQLIDLEKVRVPRWLGLTSKSRWCLHGFCDASERAYAVALYAVLDAEEGASSKLIAAKCKVSPIKVISLPRLELCGAFLLSRLTTYLLPKLEHQPRRIFCWTDSQIVLAWLKSHPSRWKSFIANRVSEIISSMPNATWNHVRSAENPADLATRGLTPLQLQEASLWWRGPSWLQMPGENWPSIHTQDFETQEEARTIKNVFSVTTEKNLDLSEWITKYSSVDKLCRILAYICRWRMNAQKRPHERRLIWLSAKELAAGNGLLMRIVQRDSFKAEIKVLSSRETVAVTSAISRLSPFLDQDGILRVGGRLQNAYLNEEEKHPIILPGKHHVVRLLISKAHRITLHGGPTLVQSHLARQYWIVRGRNVIRGLVRRCVTCTRHRASTLQQQMGPLPAVRTRPARPFTYTGVDFAGPFCIRCSAGRGQKAFKGYVSIFICMVVRAVHIEVVSDLTSSAFLAAFRRFTARRGLCKVIFSDNGKNFLGADAELRRLFSEASAMSQEIAAELARNQVEWRYIPPRAPNFGGLWEAGVKSFKGHLKRVIGDSILTFEEFYTVTSGIEACLNSRPLSLLSSSEEDIAALTPGHFLIGCAMTAPPEPYRETNESHSFSSRWHLTTLMRNHFWRRWQKEFLAQAQQKAKWLQPNRTFTIGDVVLFKDELMPPTKWPLARITELYPGVDGLSRVAKIKTAWSEYKRPVNKLIWLPCNEEASLHLAQLNKLMTSEEKENRTSPINPKNRG